MWRSIHSWIGLLLALLVMVMSGTGTILATKPIYYHFKVASDVSGLSVADVIKRIADTNPGIDPQQLVREPTGEYVLSYSRRGNINQRAVNLKTGKLVRAEREPDLYEFVRKLHRSFLFGDKGRIISAIAGIVMAVLLLSGIMLLIRRLGGIRYFFATMSWRGVANQHAGIGRLALIPLMITVLTALWLSAVTFHLVSSGGDKPPRIGESLKKLEPVKPWTLHGLQEMKMEGVTAIVYPIPEDWTDAWAVKTATQTITVDQFTGDVIYTDTLPIMAQIMSWVRFLHTAEGSTVWAVILLISSLSVPFFAFTGVWIWWKNKRQGKGRIKHNASAAQATTLIVVGSESGSTWGFAKALHKTLHESGEAVRSIDMNALGKEYPKLKTLIAMTATYGDGDAPKSATRFLSRLETFAVKHKGLQHATLSFGDKAFPAYCAFGKRVANALKMHFGEPLIDSTEVDKQSAQTFEYWCALLGDALGKELEVNYQPKRPKTHMLMLVEKQVYGEAVGTTIAVLRFKAKRLPKHHPGDLVAIYPPETVVPRLYSLGSDSKKDGYLEICVRLQHGGLCSTWLCELDIGEEIDVNIQMNERFRLPKKAKSIIMVGAGTGIAPFTGMIRHNKTHQIQLFWGGRDPSSDALYATEIEQWLKDNRLTHFIPAWSRVHDKQYVQHQIEKAKDSLRNELAKGATIMVCGGGDMAKAVRDCFEDIAHSMGTSVAELKRKKRYMEDVY